MSQLSTELSGVSIFDKIQLDIIDSSVSYCVANLREIDSGHSRISDLGLQTNDIEEVKTKEISYQWCYDNIEQYLSNNQQERKRASFENLKVPSNDRTVNKDNFCNQQNDYIASEINQTSTNVTKANENLSNTDHQQITVKTDVDEINDLDVLLNAPTQSNSIHSKTGLLIKILIVITMIVFLL